MPNKPINNVVVAKDEKTGLYLFSDLQGPLAQWLSLLILAPLAVQHGQVVQGGRHLERGRERVKERQEI